MISTHEEKSNVRVSWTWALVSKRASIFWGAKADSSRPRAMTHQGDSLTKRWSTSLNAMGKSFSERGVATEAGRAQARAEPPADVLDSIRGPRTRSQRCVR